MANPQRKVPPLRAAQMQAPAGSHGWLLVPRIRFELLASDLPAQYAVVAANMARDLSARLRLLGDEFARRH